MRIVGTAESLWRYPVKSMRGEERDELFVGYGGVYGDRLFAFESSANARGFPFFTGRDQRQMLRYRPRWRHPERAARPVNLVEAETMSHMINPITASHADLMIDVEAPDGQTFAIDDPALIETLRAGLDGEPQLTLLRSDKAMTDCRPLSIFAVQTAQKLGEETSLAVDQRRFRANVYLDLESGEGFGEDRFVGRNLRIGSKVVVSRSRARRPLHDGHARSRYRRENPSYPKSRRAGARRDGRRLRCRARRRYHPPRRCDRGN